MSTLAAAALALGLVCATVASAAAAPTTKQWKQAEAVARAHVTASGRELVDLRRKPGSTLGTAFWIRTKGADGALAGGLVLVRGADVFAERGEETIRAILRRDRQLATHAISAADVVYLLQQLHTLPAGMENPIIGFRKEVDPRFTYRKGQATLVVHTHRVVHRGATPTPTLTLTRATLTIDADYQLSWAPLEPVEVPDRR